jgi:hypothetical protein
MAKKCIPGVFCIENMTLAVFFFLFVVLAYLYYVFIVKVGGNHVSQMQSPQSIIMIQPPPVSDILPTRGISTRTAPNVILDPYGPPFRTDDMYFPNDSADIRGIPLPVISAGRGPSVARGVPVNIETRGLPTDYTQMGILTRGNGSDMILPLMGRRLVSGLDKWQYYTISNTGNMNTKLPISVKGRSCSGEYGCDCVNNGDVVYVEGYKDTFQVTLYENSRFNYIPYI